MIIENHWVEYLPQGMSVLTAWYQLILFLKKNHSAGMIEYHPSEDTLLKRVTP